ncbi:hypothetical protein K2173_023923 [Erythroxylum novogranatense]|uniref:Chlororespiratory reduction 4 n=1 Tax=Erythroxylum novogranatense TaxID=1862640 RepID=A0AAV8TQF0_9ROSI|nr:hypothetical protein K2173_023923 [Erythroxylum novogranatense]
MFALFQKLPLQMKLRCSSLNLLRNLSSSGATCRDFTCFSTLLQGRVSHSHLLQIHARVFRLHLSQDNLIATRLIGHYPHGIALRVFSQLKKPNLFPFNAIIRVSAYGGHFADSFFIFRKLKRCSLPPNDLTFSFILKSCLQSEEALHVEQIHTHVWKMGYCRDPFLCSGLIAIYAKARKNFAVYGLKVFDQISDKSMVFCWTTLMAGFAQSGQSQEVLRLFCLMVKENVKPEDDTMVSVLSACSNLDVALIENWITILSEFVKDFEGSCCDSVYIVLVYLYGKWGMIERSKESFDRITSNGKRRVLSWNSMINAYVQNGFPLEALDLFRIMVQDPNNRPNHVTMVSVLSACAQIGDLDLGIWVHEYMKSEGRRSVIESNKVLATALIDMYCKCGSLEKAKEVFDEMALKDVVSFNAIIMGLAVNGKGHEAIELFSRMQEFSLRPNAGTFLGLLCACSHSGLSDRGRQIFIDMRSRFFIHPKLEHYACYIDLLAREGHVEEALDVAASMPFKPNNFVWGALLGGCLLHSRLDLAQNIYSRLLEVDPDNSAGYVMLANVLAGDQRWTDVSSVRWFMREKGVKKQPGCSWIGVEGIVHEFLAGSPWHPQIEIIYQTLHELSKKMRVASSC